MNAAGLEVGDRQRAADAEPAGLSRNARLAVAATLAFCALCMVVIARLRGGWLDEFWTVWLTNPKLGLHEVFWTRWMGDTPHPPLFGFVVWLLAPFTGEELADRRLVNALAILLIVPTALLCLRRGKGQVQPVLFGLAICANPYFIAYFGEHRSYFLGLAAMSCLTATVRQCHVESRASGAVPRRSLLIWLFVTAAVTINIHYMLAIIACTLLGCAALYHWFRPHRAMAVWFAGTGVVASLPLILMAGIEFHIHATPAAPSIPFTAGLFNMALVMAAAALGNLVLLYGAMGGAVHLVQDREKILDQRGAQLSFMGIMLATLVAITIIFAVIAAALQIMVPRQFLGSVPIIVGILCELAAMKFSGSKALLLICANALLIAGVTTVLTIKNRRWEFNAAEIQQAVRVCPTTRVLALDPFSDQPPGNLSPGAHAVAAIGYRLIGEKYGFSVTSVPQQKPTPVGEGPCPTIVWMEHNFFHMNPPPGQVAAQANLNLNGATIGKLESGDGHLLMSINPSPPPAPGRE